MWMTSLQSDEAIMNEEETVLLTRVDEELRGLPKPHTCVKLRLILRNVRGTQCRFEDLAERKRGQQ